METKKKPQVKKMKVNINADTITKQVKDFYNEHLKKSHVIFTIITILIYVIYFAYMFHLYRSGNLKVAQDITANNFLGYVNNCFFLTVIIIIAGITPYFYLSVLGLLIPLDLVGNLLARYVLGYSFMPTLFIGGLIEMLAYSLCISVGIYFCKLSSKKNKYYHYSDFSVNDLKKQVYEIRKDKDKVEEIEKKQEEKKKEIEKCNIKIPYLNFAILGIVAFVVECVGVLITLI